MTAAKMHVGHLESAAGAVGLLKAMLMCQHRRQEKTGGRWAAVGLLGRHQDEAHLEAYVNSHKLATRIPSSVDGQVTDFQRFEHVFGNSDLGFRAARIGSNKKLVVTSASLLVTSALLVVTRSY